METTTNGRVNVSVTGLMAKQIQFVREREAMDMLYNYTISVLPVTHDMYLEDIWNITRDSISALCDVIKRDDNFIDIREFENFNDYCKYHSQPRSELFMVMMTHGISLNYID